MNEKQALAILVRVKAALGRNYKAAIREAWMTGNYAAQSLEPWTGELQTIRNTLGPSWLVRAKPVLEITDTLKTQELRLRSLHTKQTLAG